MQKAFDSWVNKKHNFPKNYSNLLYYQNFQMKFYLFLVLTCPVFLWGQPTIYTFNVYSGLRSKTEVYIQKSDTVLISAYGSITLGAFAGKSSPAGLSGGRFSMYNAVSGAPHGALLTKIGEGRYWELAGKALKMVAEMDGYLHLLVNDSDPRNNYGYYTTKVEIRPANDQIILGQIEGEDVWVNKDFEEDKKVYFRDMTFEQESDNRWYIKGKPNGEVLNIVQIKDETPKLLPKDKELRSVLSHINRNQLNREAKGKLTYLCSTEIDASVSTSVVGYFQDCGDLLYHFYTDQNNCIWALALACESIYHKNPDNESQTGFKFTRMAAKDFQQNNLSYESVRIPLSNESHGSAQIIGKTFQLKDDLGQTHRSANLRHSSYKGTYNFAHSIFASQSLPKFLDHNELDIKPHKNWQHYTVFFPEKYDTPSSREVALIRNTRELPVVDGLRTCALDGFIWK